MIKRTTITLLTIVVIATISLAEPLICLPDHFTMAELIDAINNLEHNIYGTQSKWTQEDWHLFDSLKGQANYKSEVPEFNAYSKVTYPLYDGSDISPETAQKIALSQNPGSEIFSCVLFEYDKVRNYKVVTRSGWISTDYGAKKATQMNGFEIDANSGIILLSYDAFGVEQWRNYIPEALWKEMMETNLNSKEAYHLAIDALTENYSSAIQFDDNTQFEINMTYQNNENRWRFIFTPRISTKEFPTDLIVYVYNDQSVEIQQ